MSLFKTYLFIYTWKNIRKQNKNKKLKLIALTWNDEFELSYGSYSVSGIQEYTEFVTKMYETLTAIPPIHVYINRINNILVFKIKELARITHAWNNEIIWQHKKINRRKSTKSWSSWSSFSPI